MARVAIAANSHWPAPGGAQTYQRLLGRWLAQHHEVTVLTQHVYGGRTRVLDRTFAHRRFPSFEDKAVRVECVGPARAERFTLCPFALINLPVGTQVKRRLQIPLDRWFAAVCAPSLRVRLQDFDLVHSFSLRYLGSAVIRAARQVGIPVVVTPLVHPRWWLDDPYSLELIRVCDFVFAQLEYDQEFLIDRGVSPTRVEAVGAPYWVESSGNGARAREHYTLGTEPVVLFIGVRRPYKGYDLLLEAAPVVWKTFRDTRFVLVGRHTPASRRSFLHEADGRIIDLDQVDEQLSQDLLAACDILCLPSESESFGIGYLEAWHYGKPVVALNSPASAELVADTGGGLLVEHDALSLAEALCSLLADSDLRSSLGHSGRRTPDQYMIERVGSRVHAIYSQLIGPGIVSG